MKERPSTSEQLKSRTQIGYGIYVDTCKAFGFKGEPDTIDALSDYFESSPFSVCETPRLVQFQIDRGIHRGGFEPIHDTLMRFKVMQDADAALAFPEHKVDFSKQPGLARYMLEKLALVASGKLKDIYPSRNRSFTEYQPYLAI